MQVQTVSDANSSTKKSVIKKFDTLAPREQKLLMIAVPLSICLLVFFSLVEPDINAGGKLKSQAKKMEIQLKVNEETNNQLMAQLNEDPNITLRQQITGLNQRLNQLNSEFTSEMAQLVSPQAMSVMLEALLNKASNLELLEMSSQEPTILKLQTTERSSSRDEQPIYKHELKLKLKGDFVSTRNFISDAEQIGWKIYWQDMTYQVTEHPKANIELSLFTLSTSEAFIGVN